MEVFIHNDARVDIQDVQCPGSTGRGRLSLSTSEKFLKVFACLAPSTLSSLSALMRTGLDMMHRDDSTR